jgi:hypothetical protein
MSQGSPAPLLPADVLSAVLPLIPPGGVAGAWLRGCRRLLHVRSAGQSLLVCSDLGLLLRRCNRIAIRHRQRVVVVEAERLIAWRTLRIVTGATELPGVEQLRRLIPRLEARGSRIDVPIGLGGPEEALAACVAARVPVVASSITYRD